jgi:hypothetical protein
VDSGLNTTGLFPVCGPRDITQYVFSQINYRTLTIQPVGTNHLPVACILVLLKNCVYYLRADRLNFTTVWNKKFFRPPSIPAYAVCHNIQLPFFSAFHDIGHRLSMFILDPLMMAFWNVETCRAILSTNTLSEWCICWSLTHRPNCKIFNASTHIQKFKISFHSVALSKFYPASNT